MRRLIIPSWGVPGTGRRGTRLIALLAVRNGVRHLPGFLRNVSSQVDGIVALDDGSADRSFELLTAHPSVLEVLRRPSDRPFWDEVANHRQLVHAALRHNAQWIVCVDADERLERDFRTRAERVIARGRWFGMSAFAVRVRELWDRTDQFRVDGIWGRKFVARLFRAREDHEFDTRPFHSHKAPLQGKYRGRYPLTDLTIYHLGMLHPEDRAARRRRYELLDPESRWQAIGYAYLTDERGLQLSRVAPNRAFSD